MPRGVVGFVTMQLGRRGGGGGGFPGLFINSSDLLSITVGREEENVTFFCRRSRAAWSGLNGNCTVRHHSSARYGGRWVRYCRLGRSCDLEARSLHVCGRAS